MRLRRAIPFPLSFGSDVTFALVFRRFRSISVYLKNVFGRFLEVRGGGGGLAEFQPSRHDLRWILDSPPPPPLVSPLE